MAVPSRANKQYGIYFQDDWEVNDHLIVNLGLRYDYEDSPSYTDFVTPADVVAALRCIHRDQRPGFGREHRRLTSAPATTAIRSRTAGSRAWASRTTSTPTSAT